MDKVTLLRHILVITCLFYNLNAQSEEKAPICDDESKYDPRCDSFCDIGFVLDTSGSIHKDEYVKQKHFVAAVARHIGIKRYGPHYGVVLFGQFATVDVKFNDYYNADEFENAVMDLKQSGSITRIDRGLEKAYSVLFRPEGGSRKKADKFLFLLTDGSQSQGRDVVESHLIAKSLRFAGVDFYVIGIGRSVNPKELAEIGGGKEHVFLSKDFDELVSEKFINQFNISCKHGFKGNKKYRYHLKAYVINNASMASTVQVLPSYSNDVEEFTVEQNGKHTIEQIYQTASTPFIKVSAVSKTGSKIFYANGSKYLAVNFGKAERETVIYIDDTGIQELKLRRVIFSVYNQLSEPILVKWFSEGKQQSIEVSSRPLFYLTAYVYGRQQADYSKDIRFTAETLDGRKVELNSQQVKGEVVNGRQENVYFYLYTKASSESKENSYTVRYQIINIGQRSVRVYLNDQSFDVNSDAFIERKYTTVSTNQPKPLQLYVQPKGDIQKYFLTYLLPTIKENFVKIFIGNDFEATWPFSYTLGVHNLIPSTTTTLKWNLINYDYTDVVTPGYTDDTFHVAYSAIIPAKRVTGFYIDNRERNRFAWINNKFTDFIGPKKRNEIIKVVVASKPGRNYWFNGYIRNENRYDIILSYSNVEINYLLENAPKNNITIPAKTDKEISLRFHSLAPLTMIKWEAFGKQNGEHYDIDGRSFVEFPLATRKPRESLPMTIKNTRIYYFKLDVLNGLLKGDATFTWKLDQNYASSLKTNQPTSYTIKSGQKLPISLRFTSISRPRLTNVLTFSATSLIDGKPLLINGYQTLTESLRPNQEEPLMIKITHPGIGEPVQDVSIVNTTSTSITIKWRPNPYTHGYRIRAVDKTNGDIVFETVKDLTPINGWVYFTLDSLKVDNTYTISVRTLAYGSKATIITGTTETGRKDIKVRFENLLESSVQISYRLKQQQQQQTVNLNAKETKDISVSLQHWTEGQNIEFVANELSSDIRRTINGLETFSFNPEDIKSEGAPLLLFVGDTNLKDPVKDLSVTNTTKTSITLKWRPNRFASGYKAVATGNSPDAVSKTIDVSNNAKDGWIYYTFNGLSLNQIYTMQINTLTKDSKSAVVKATTNLDLRKSVINLTVNNHWGKDITLKWSYLPSIEESFSINAETKNTKHRLVFFYKDTPSYGTLQCFEKSTGLLLMIFNGQDKLQIEGEKYEQNYTIDIKSVNDIVISRPYYLLFTIISFSTNTVNLRIKNILGEVITKQEITSGSTDFINLSFLYKDFPLLHYVEIEEEGTYVNGKRQLSYVPLSRRIPIYLYVGVKEDLSELPSSYFMNIQLRNNWKNPVTLLWQYASKLNKLDVGSQKSDEKTIVSSGTTKPKDQLFKLVDKYSEKNLQIGEEGVFPFSTSLQPITLEVGNMGEVNILRTYYIVLIVWNQYTEDVRFLWSDQEINIKPNERKIIKISVTNKHQPDEEVVFRTKTSSDVRLFINNKESFNVLPNILQTVRMVNITNVALNEKQFNIRFINLLRNQAQIVWPNSDNKAIIIEPKKTRIISAQYSPEEKLAMTAVTLPSGAATVINATKNMYFINPTKYDEESTIVLFIGATKEELEPTLSPYFFYINFQNLNPEDILIKWNENKQQRSLTVKAGEQVNYANIFMSRDRPKPIEVQYYSVEDGEQLFVNDKKVMKIEATLKESQVDVVLDPGSTAQLFYINLELVNTLPYATVVRADNKSLDMVYNLPSKSYTERKVQIISSKDSIQPILLNAFAQDVIQWINGVETGFVIIPGQKKNQFTLFIGYKGPVADLPYLNVIKTDLQFTNNRDKPVSIKWQEGDDKKLRIVNPGKTITYQNLHVSKYKEFPVFTFYDERTGKSLLPNNKRQTRYDLKVFKDGRYSYHGNTTLKPETLEALFMSDVTLTIINHEDTTTDTQVKYASLEPATYTVEPFGQKIVSLSLPVIHKGNSILFRARSNDGHNSMLVNGRRGQFEIPLTDRKINVILNVHNTGQIAGSVFTVLNTLNYPIKLSSDSVKSNSETPIIRPGEKHKFMIYMPREDGVENSLKISAKSAEEDAPERPIRLNGYKQFWLSLGDEGAEKNTAVLATDENEKSTSSVAILDITNLEDQPIVLHQSLTDTSEKALPSRLIDGGEQKRIYIHFANLASELTLRARGYKSDKTLALNNKFVLKLKPNDVYPMKLNVKAYDSDMQQYTYNLDISNPYGQDITVQWVEGGILRTNVIPKNDRMFLSGNIEAFQQPEGILLGAKSLAGNLMYINGEKEFKIQPSLKSKTQFVTLSNEVEHATKNENYFVKLSALNNLNEKVSLFWEWSGKGYISEIQPGKEKLIELFKRSETTPKAILFRGYTSSNKEEVALNSQDTFEITPSKENNVVPLYIDKKDNDIETYYCNIKFINRYPLPVNIEWHVNKERRIFTIPANAETLIKDSFRTNSKNVELIPFQAWDVTSKRNILMNKRKLFKYSPSTNLVQQEEVILSPDESTYIYKAVVDSFNENDIELKWMYKSKENTFDNSLATSIDIKSQRKDYEIIKQYDRLPYAIIATAFNVYDGKQVYINDKLSVKLNQTSNGRTNYLKIGKEASEQSYYFKLILSNLYGRTVALNWTMNGEKQIRYIPPYYFNYVVKGVVKGFAAKPVSFNSYILHNNKAMLTNDESVFTVLPKTKDESKHTFVFISSYVTKRTTKLYFKNLAANDVDIEWQTRFFSGSATIPKLQSRYPVTIVTKGGYRNQKVTIRALSNDNGDVVVNSDSKFVTRIPYGKIIHLNYLQKEIILNNTLSYDVVVTSTPKGYTSTVSANSFIKVLIPGKALRNNEITFTATNKEQKVSINGDKQFILSLDSDVLALQLGAPSLLKYYVRLWLSNNHTRTVSLYWTGSENSGKAYKIPAGVDAEYVYEFDTNSVVNLTAVDSRTKNLVYLNQKDQLTFSPRKGNTYATSVVLNGEIYPFDYFYRLLINNNAGDDVKIILRSDGDRREASVPGNAQSYAINSPLTDVSNGLKQPMTAYAYRKDDDTQIFIDGKESVVIYPTLEDESATIIQIDGTEIPKTLFYYSALVTSPNNINLLLRYQLDGEEKFIRIPAKSKRFQVTIPIRSYRTPLPIKTIAVEENNEENVLSINDKKFEILVATSDKDSARQFIITTSSIKEVEEGKGDEKKYLFEAFINNPNFDSAILYWKFGKTIQNQTFIPAQASNMRVLFNISSKEISKYLQLSAKIDDESVAINNNQTVWITDTINSNEINVLNLSLITPNVTLYFVNKAKRLVHLKYEIEGRPHMAQIDANGGDIEVPMGKRITFTSMVHDILLNDQIFLVYVSDRDNNKTIVLTKVNYQVRLIVHNPLNRNIYLNWTNDGKTNETVISPNTDNFEIIFNVSKPQMIHFNAYDHNLNPLIINNGSMFSVTPNVRGEKTTIRIADPPQTFYYNIRLKNKDQIPLTVTCYYNGEKETMEIKAGVDTSMLQFEQQREADLSVSSTASFEASCTVENTVNSKQLLMNSQNQLSIQPTENSDEYIDVVVTDQAFQCKLLVTNSLPVDAILRWKVNDQDITYTVQANTEDEEVVINTASDNRLVLHATTEQKRPLSMNDIDSLAVYPKLTTNDVIPVDIQAITFYYGIQVDNLELFQTMIQWNIHGKYNSKPIKGLHSKDILLEDTNLDMPLDAVTFTAVRHWRGAPLLINNKDELVVEPRRSKYHFKDALISSTKRDLNAMKFITVTVTNLVQDDVILEWIPTEVGEDNEPQVEIIERNKNRHFMKIPFAMDAPALVKFSAIVDKDSKGVLINRQNFILLKPKMSKKAVNLIITDKDSLDDVYHAHIEVQNHHYNPITIEYRQAGIKGDHGISVPEHYHQWFNLAFLKPTGYPMSIELKAYDAEHHTLLKMNYQISVLFQPKRRQETLTLSIGDAVPQTKIGLRDPVTRGKIYFFGIHVTNQGSKDVVVKWQERGIVKSLTIPAYSFRTYRSLVKSKNGQKPWLAVKGKNGVRVNGKSVYFIQTSAAKKMNYLFVNADEKSFPTQQYYYYGLKIDNLANFDVDIRWNEGQTAKSIVVKSTRTGSYHNIIKSLTQPAVFTVTGYKSGTDEQVLLNYRQSLDIKPSRRNVLTYILIEPEDNSARSLTFFVGFDVKNLLKTPIVLKWFEYEIEKQLFVNAYGSQHYDMTFTSSVQPKNINVTAYDKTSGQLLRIYNKDVITMTPSRERGRYVLVIGEDKSKTDYDYDLTIQVYNRDDVPLSLAWIEDDGPKYFKVAPKSVVRTDITIKSPTQPAPMYFRVRNQVNNKWGKINGLEALSLQPKRNGYFAHVYIASNGLYKPGYIRKGQEYCRKKLDIAFLMDSSGTMKGAYKYAQQFIMLLAEHFHLGENSTHIGVITFSETAELEIPFDKHQNHKDFQDDVYNIPFLGHRTRIDLAFDVANERLFNKKHGARDEASKLLILLTDGRHTHDNEQSQLKKAYDSSLPLLAKDVKIVAIGLFGTEATDAQMLSYLTRNEKNVYMIEHSPDLLSEPFLEGITQNYCPV